jgi:hypothetical protein
MKQNEERNEYVASVPKHDVDQEILFNEAINSTIDVTGDESLQTKHRFTD